MSGFHKDKNGIMLCDNCNGVVYWMQNKDGKWYLGNGKKMLRDNSSYYEYSSEIVSVPFGKIPHYLSCEHNKKMNERKAEENG